MSVQTAPAASLRTLLHGLVDFAGLYPPAELAMDDAVQRYAEYRRGPHAWMLGRYVVPAPRLAEFARAAEPFLAPGAVPWRASVVSAGTDVAADVGAIAALNASHRGIECDALEVRAASADEIARIARAVRGAPLAVFVELPPDPDPSPLIAELAARALRAKLRTGGVTASAFPAADAIVRFIAACVRSGVPFKATAGLHHPFCGEYRLTYAAGSAAAPMFGYLNLFLAAALLRDGASADDAVALLTERDAGNVVFADDGVRWRSHLMLTARLAQLRERAALSFGSCSFTEPVDELGALLPR